MKCLITGASGFLGGAVARAAAAADHEIVALGRAANPPSFMPGEYRTVDFSSPGEIEQAVRDTAPDCVLHFAGTASVGGSFAEPLRDFEDSTCLWFRVLDAIRRSELRPLVLLASSAAVYGSPAELPTPETAERHPQSPYGFHKLMSEQIGEEFARCFGLSIASLRFFSIFGPSQRRLLVWEIFNQLRSGAPELHLKGTGVARRDFLAEEEAAVATVSLAEALMSQSSPPGFRAINVASGASVSVREVAEQVRACLGSNAKIVFGHMDLPGDPLRWQADIGELRRFFPGWQPESFTVSMAKCIAAWNGTPAGGVPVNV